ncbi:MAG: hypothetical protein GY950_28970 [bacterium]|nr:hypothetical protein [bacterium]
MKTKEDNEKKKTSKFPTAGQAIYRTFLKSQSSHGLSHYFEIDDPVQVGNYNYLRIYRGSEASSTLMQAFSQGKGVEVQIGYPHNPPPDGKLTATVKWARIIWRP